MNPHPPDAAAGTASSSRPYETEHDLLQMQGLLMEARSQTDDRRRPHLGGLMWGFFMVVCHLDPQSEIRLWHDDEGKLVGYAILDEGPPFDCQVRPKSEWPGIEYKAPAWAEGRVAGLRRDDAQRWGGRLAAGAHQDDAEGIAFLEQHGFRYSSRFVEVDMHRSADEPIAQVVLPAGCQVRAVAETGEISNRGAAQREVWQTWTVGNVGDDDYAALMWLPGYHRGSTWLPSRRMASSPRTRTAGSTRSIASATSARSAPARPTGGRA